MEENQIYYSSLEEFLVALEENAPRCVFNALCSPQHYHLEESNWTANFLGQDGKDHIYGRAEGAVIQNAIKEIRKATSDLKIPFLRGELRIIEKKKCYYFFAGKFETTQDKNPGECWKNIIESLPKEKLSSKVDTNYTHQIIGVFYKEECFILVIPTREFSEKVELYKKIPSLKKSNVGKDFWEKVASCC